MKKLPFHPQIALFAYDFPHWKSEKILFDCLKNGIDVRAVVAAPKFDLNTKREIQAMPAENLKSLCKLHNVEYLRSCHDDLDGIRDLIERKSCNLV